MRSTDRMRATTSTGEEVVPWRLLGPVTVVHGAAVIAAAAGALWLGLSPVVVAAWMALGWILWSLAEYLIHRFIQHGPPMRRLAMLDDHRGHHFHPEDLDDLVYALRHSVPTWALVLALGMVFTWSLAGDLALFAGVLVGYLNYEWLHLCSHVPALVARRPLLRRWARNHHRHHFGSP